MKDSGFKIEDLGFSHGNLKVKTKGNRNWQSVTQ